jgi:Domain of unknown function (DUF1772)
MKEVAMPWRARLTRMMLWISVLAWGILLGGKLFDHVVLVGAWSLSPPESLSLLPYGPRFPVDTGDFFFPSSVALLMCSFGVMITGWKTPLRFRVLLAVPAVMLLVTLIFTVLWFWPANRALWHVATGAPDAIRDRAAVIRLVRQWVTYDWLRIAVGAVGLMCSVRAISVPFPAAQDLRVAETAK